MTESTKKRGKAVEVPPRVPNAWSAALGEGFRLEANRFHRLLGPPEMAGRSEVLPGDGLLLSEGGSGEWRGVAFVRVYRVRCSLEATEFWFDRFLPLDAEPSLEVLGLVDPTSTYMLERLPLSDFERLLRSSAGLEFSALPPVTDRTHVRELLRLALEDDLLGPADGPHEEIVEMSVRDRYLVGKLAPRDATPVPPSEVEGGREEVEALEELRPLEGVALDPDQEFGGTDGRSDRDEDIAELDASTNASLVPSSLGFTFQTSAEATHLEVEVRWGRYEKTTSTLHSSEKTGKPIGAWRRVPSGGTVVLALSDTDRSEPLVPDPQQPSVVLRATVRSMSRNGERTVTLFLVNAQTQPETLVDGAWLFQPEMVVRDLSGEAVFRRRNPLTPDGSDPEREALEMLYRNRVEFAVGHGVSVATRVDLHNPQWASEIRTRVIPGHELPVTETPDLEGLPADFMDMRRLASLERADLVSGLEAFVALYGGWIASERSRVMADAPDWDEAARAAMERCEHILSRLNEGVAVLNTDDRALEAFRFANLAMADQRVRSIYALRRRRGETLRPEDADIAKNRSWRAFQLAFVLLSVPALANPLHPHRTDPAEAEADLLWFPTGGGKTEAYLGVAAFAMSVRRLQDGWGELDSSRGLAVIMRYTLRLLTLQQFQRATTLMCSMEVLREADMTQWGVHPFEIGLWVGQKVTPNSTKESHESIRTEREGGRSTGSTPAQLTTCPWCGEPIDPSKNVVVDLESGRTHIFCSNVVERCRFSDLGGSSRGLPVVVVDEELYHRPPTLMIATVDKFAMMAWKGETRTLFGRVELECPRHGLLWPDSTCTGNHPRKGTLPAVTVEKVRAIRPPDLIIQDEFHLISGPLGTMVGLYETAVDHLSSWAFEGALVRPKVVASTATVRKAREQVNGVFARKVAVFPPHGLDVEDNFFSNQRSVAHAPGRLYLGICAPGSSKPAMLIRVYVALLTAGKSLFEHFGDAADPYMTLVGYFNALRELGGMRRLSEDDVNTRAFRVSLSKISRPGLMQRRVNIVEELTSRVSSREIPQKLDQLEIKYKTEWNKGDTKSIDVVLATNMLSVGVDVNRLGLMAVNGQPKTTAEYIQATSRVGRSFPGLVVTVLAWSRPRDLSHYETFEHYHSTFYKHVEAQSVTPFAPRALDRGFTGTLVSLLRLGYAQLNPDTGAEKVNQGPGVYTSETKMVLTDRAGEVTGKTRVAVATGTLFAARMDRWTREASRPGRQLGYQGGKATVVGLLERPGASPWQEFTAPMSMREVEPGVRLVMDHKRRTDEAPAWRAASGSSSEGEME